MFKHFLFFASLTGSAFLGTTTQAQHHHSCGTTEVNEARRKAGHLPQREVFEQWIAKNISKLEVARTEDGTDRYIVPIVYHIIHTGEAIGTGYNLPYSQVVSQNKVINEDFNRLNADSVNTPQVFRSRAANFGIEFRLAEIDPQGNRLAEAGVVRHNISGLGLDVKKLFSEDIDKKIAPSRVFPPNFAINQFVVPSAAFPPESPGGDPTPLYGYATFPGDSGAKGDDTPSDVPLSVTVYNAFGSIKDGNFSNMDNSADRGRTTTHELGHYFALFHIWGDENECAADDNCDDTPRQAKSNQGSRECDKVVQSCETGIQEMRQNYMDYTDDECLNLFTNDQKKRFLAVMKNSKTRKDLPFSEAIRPHAAPSNLVAALNSNGEVELKWKDNATNEKEFSIERSEGGAFVALTKTAANSTSFTDNNNLVAGKKYTYRIKAGNRAGETGFSPTSNEVTIAEVTGIENEILQSNLQISPNPTNGMVQLQLNLPYSSELKITVTDLLGKVVATSQVENNHQHRQQIDLSKLAAGMYLIKVQTQKGFATKKVIVQK